MRLSRGVGLPGRAPDILGLAIRIIDAHGADRPQDLLLVTSAAPAVARHSILFGRRFGAGFYSSILPYRCGGDLVLFGARPMWPDGVDLDAATTITFDQVQGEIESGRLRFELLVADLTGPWQTVATVDGGRRLTAPEEESLRFNVFNTGEALEPYGVLNAMRRSVYRASQNARPTPMQDPTSADSAA